MSDEYMMQFWGEKENGLTRRGDTVWTPIIIAELPIFAENPVAVFTELANAMKMLGDELAKVAKVEIFQKISPVNSKFSHWNQIGTLHPNGLYPSWRNLKTVESVARPAPAQLESGK